MPRQMKVSTSLPSLPPSTVPGNAASSRPTPASTRHAPTAGSPSGVHVGDVDNTVTGLRSATLKLTLSTSQASLPTRLPPLWRDSADWRNPAGCSDSEAAPSVSASPGAGGAGGSTSPLTLSARAQLLGSLRPAMSHTYTHSSAGRILYQPPRVRKPKPPAAAPDLFEQYFRLLGVPETRSQLRTITQLTGSSDQIAVEWFSQRVDAYATEKATLRALNRPLKGALQGRELVDEILAGHVLLEEEMVQLKDLAEREQVRSPVLVRLGHVQLAFLF
eukprot:1484514-Prymnesium_polylepis.1